VKQCNISDSFKASSRLSVLVRRGLVKSGYVLTEAGRRKLGESEPFPPESVTSEVVETTIKETSESLRPPMPDARLLAPGSFWVWDEELRKYVARRKYENRGGSGRLRPEEVQLFP
jgi:hypothetical protein